LSNILNNPWFNPTILKILFAMNDAMANSLAGQAASGAMLETDGGHGRYIGISVRSVRSHFCTGVSGWLTEVRISQDWVREGQEVGR
jgi:hypothetical protein